MYTFAAVELLEQHDSSKLILVLWWRHHLLPQSIDADPKPGYDNARYYAIQITASQQFLDQPGDTSVSVARSSNCEFTAISRYMSETIQASASYYRPNIIW